MRPVKQIRVLIIDHSLLSRDVLKQALSGVRDIHLVGATPSGNTGVSRTEQVAPEVVVVNGGLQDLSPETLTRRIHAINPEVGVLLVTHQDGPDQHSEAMARALEAGAFGSVAHSAKDLRRDDAPAILARLVLPKIRNYTTTKLSKEAIGKSTGTYPIVAAPPASPPPRAQAPAGRPPVATPPPAVPPAAISTPPPSMALAGIPAVSAAAPPLVAGSASPQQEPKSRRGSRIKVVVIGVSTGGPEALGQLLPLLPRTFQVPVVVVIHLPGLFTSSLVSSLQQRCPLQVQEAADGRPLTPGTIIVASGGKHLQVRCGAHKELVMRTPTLPPRNGCCPSVDVLFESAARYCPAATIAVLLTGMGGDGVDGMRAIQASGGHTLAQDRVSSVVWGMPGRAVQAGVADEVVPLRKMSARILDLVSKS